MVSVVEPSSKIQIKLLDVIPVPTLQGNISPEDKPCIVPVVYIPAVLISTTI